MLFENSEFVSKFQIWYLTKGKPEIHTYFNTKLAQEYCNYFETQFFNKIEFKQMKPIK